MISPDSYNFSEHTHRYAIWTAARAVQRGFTNTARIWAAIDRTSLRNFSETLPLIMEEEFDHQFDSWCRLLKESFVPVSCSYGRAAKIVSIYLKTSVVLATKGAHSLCEIIHPPLDSILLKNLLSQVPPLSGQTLIWTQFEHEDYWEVVRIIRDKMKFNWRLEVNWQPTNGKAE